MNGNGNGHTNHRNGEHKSVEEARAPWESALGYSKAVHSGNMIFVSGTTAANDKGEISCPDDPKEQMLIALRHLEKALRSAGAALKDVVQTRIYVVDMDQWEEIGKAYSDFFKNIKPATSLLEVNSLVHPDMLVEIEAIAVLSESNGSAPAHA